MLPVKPRNGRDGRDGRDGKDGLNGLAGQPPKIEINGKSIRFEKAGGGWTDWIDTQGAAGADGKDGIDGADGKSVAMGELIQLITEQINALPKPKDGKDGKNGKDGKGEDGKDGKNGKNGKNGADGLSAYEIWLSLGHEGDEEDFFDWLIKRAMERIKKLYPGVIGHPPGGGGGSNPPLKLDGGFGFVIMSRDGNPLQAGDQAFMPIPYDMKITEWTLLGDISGSAVVDIWVSSYADAFPDSSDTITGSAKPTITSSVKGRGSTLTGWTTQLLSGQVMVINIISISNITKLNVALKGARI